MQGYTNSLHQLVTTTRKGRHETRDLTIIGVFTHDEF